MNKKHWSVVFILLIAFCGTGLRPVLARDPLPQCCGFLLPRPEIPLVLEEDYLTVIPIIGQGGTREHTRVEVWYHPDAHPTTETGWTYLGKVPLGSALLWSGKGAKPGQHTVALQVYDFGVLVHSWLWNRSVMTSVVFR